MKRKRIKQKNATYTAYGNFISLDKNDYSFERETEIVERLNIYDNGCFMLFYKL